MEWMILPLKRYFEMRGRSRRKEFWMFVLFTIIAGIVASMIDALLGFGTTSQFAGPGGYGAGFRDNGPINGIVSLLLLVPTFTVTARRLHDTERSAWWMLLILIPLLGWIALLVFYCEHGTRGSNRFGGDPKGEDVAEVFR